MPFWFDPAKSFTHPVEYVCPALHGNALEDGEHGKCKVVKIGDSVLGPVPARITEGLIGTVASIIARKGTGRGLLF